VLNSLLGREWFVEVARAVDEAEGDFRFESSDLRFDISDLRFEYRTFRAELSGLGFEMSVLKCPF
jgi:hypothetical protein